MGESRAVKEAQTGRLEVSRPGRTSKKERGADGCADRLQKEMQKEDEELFNDEEDDEDDDAAG